MTLCPDCGRGMAPGVDGLVVHWASNAIECGRVLG